MIRSDASVILAKSPYFSKQNLSLILGKDRDSLDYWIKTLLSDGRLIALKNGFYISRDYLTALSFDPDRREKYLACLANILRYPSYVSLEYVLSRNNVIPEAVSALTSVTSKSSRSFGTPLGLFTYRTLKESLFWGYDLTDFQGNKVKIASRSKALFDFLYLRRFASPQAMNEYLTRGSRIN